MAARSGWCTCRIQDQDVASNTLIRADVELSVRMKDVAATLEACFRRLVSSLHSWSWSRCQRLSDVDWRAPLTSPLILWHESYANPKLWKVKKRRSRYKREFGRDPSPPQISLFWKKNNTKLDLLEFGRKSLIGSLPKY